MQERRLACHLGVRHDRAGALAQEGHGVDLVALLREEGEVVLGVAPGCRQRALHGQQFMASGCISPPQ